MILLLVAEEVERLVLCRSEGDSDVFLCIRLCRIACLMDRTSDDGYLQTSKTKAKPFHRLPSSIDGLLLKSFTFFKRVVSGA